MITNEQASRVIDRMFELEGEGPKDDAEWFAWVAADVGVDFSAPEDGWVYHHVWAAYRGPSSF